MTYQKVKEVINKVIEILKEISQLDNEALSAMVPEYPSDNRANLVQSIIISRLTTEEYDIYVKYCEFYKSQKTLELKETVVALNTQIETLNDLYDERQRTLQERSNLNDQQTNLTRTISTLPWIRLKIAYSNLSKEHETYIKAVTSGIIKETQISDEITSIEEGNIITRAKNKRRLVALEEKESSLKLRHSRQHSVMRKRVVALVENYQEVLHDIIQSALANETIFKNACLSYPYYTKKTLEGSREEQVNSIIASILEQAENILSSQIDPISTYQEEDVYPPFGKLIELSPKEYESLINSYISKYLNVSLGRCDTKASRIMGSMKNCLSEQRECIAHLNDNQGGIILDHTTPTAEEKDIFQLIYKESKH